MHYFSLILIPEAVFLRGDSYITTYITNLLAPYSEYREVEPYIYKTSEELMKEFKAKFQTEYPSYEIWLDNYYLGFNTFLKEDGNLMSTYNGESFYDFYQIGGRWEGFLTENRESNITETIRNNSLPFIRLEKFLKDNNLSLIDEEATFIDLTKANFPTYQEKYGNDYVVSIDYHN